MQLEFTFEDKEFMAQRGSEPAQVEQQFANFEKGFPFADIDRPATVDDGILRLDEDQVAELEAEYPFALTKKRRPLWRPNTPRPSRARRARSSCPRPALHPACSRTCTPC